jgi:hypothetical protein
MKLDKLTPANPLPFMRDFDDAAALFEREKDPFYLTAFLLQFWLGGLVQRATAEYAEKKNPKDRSLQNGEASRSFIEIFNPKSERLWLCLLMDMFRFCASDDSRGNSLRKALVPLSIEHNATGQYFGPKTEDSVRAAFIAASERARQHFETSVEEGPRGQQAPDLANHAAASPTSPLPSPIFPLDLPRLTIIRWCDWVDAAIHLRTHRHWHIAPEAFSPDPETRQLAALANAQPHLAELDDRAKAAWLSDLLHAAARYKDSPKWAAAAKAMSASPARLWQYAQVDTLVIALWPLVKNYNWTYRDLLSVLRPSLTRPTAYPCEREQDFATYCVNVLGLRKSAKGVSAKNGKPPAYQVAKQLCPALRKKPSPPHAI